MSSPDQIELERLAAEGKEAGHKAVEFLLANDEPTSDKYAIRALVKLASALVGAIVSIAGSFERIADEVHDVAPQIKDDLHSIAYDVSECRRSR